MTSNSQTYSIGVLSWLAMIGDTHNRLSVADFMQQLNRAMRTGHIELFCRHDKPVAWLLWRQPSQLEWLQLLAAHPLAPIDVGALQGQVWLDFWVRPFGCDEKLAQAVCQELHNKGFSPNGLNWHDPSGQNGQGDWHIHVPWQQLQGM